MFDPRDLLRPHLRELIPYSSARDDYQGSFGVFLDANENPLGSISTEKWNRYPDPYQTKLKEKIAQIKCIAADHIFLGNGSDEAIDLLYRAFCEPGIDNVIINPPTYGMYKVSADISNVAAREVLLTSDFDLDVPALLATMDMNTKMIFICSPNNPTGNDVTLSKIEEILTVYKGLVVLDEAYIDFAERTSFIEKLSTYPNLIVLQTFSKAWGLAGLRLGMAFCAPNIISILNKIKAPYNLSGLTQRTVLESLENKESMDEMVSEILSNKTELKGMLAELSVVKKIHRSDANFLLVEIDNAHAYYQRLIEKKVIVRDRSSVILCDNCLRITVGTKYENFKLVQSLKEITV